MASDHAKPDHHSDVAAILRPRHGVAEPIAQALPGPPHSRGPGGSCGTSATWNDGSGVAAVRHRAAGGGGWERHRHGDGSERRAAAGRRRAGGGVRGGTRPGVDDDRRRRRLSHRAPGRRRVLGRVRALRLRPDASADRGGRRRHAGGHRHARRRRPERSRPGVVARRPPRHRSPDAVRELLERDARRRAVAVAQLHARDRGRGRRVGAAARSHRPQPEPRDRARRPGRGRLADAEPERQRRAARPTTRCG